MRFESIVESTSCWTGEDFVDDDGVDMVEPIERANEVRRDIKEAM